MGRHADPTSRNVLRRFARFFLTGGGGPRPEARVVVGLKVPVVRKIIVVNLVVHAIHKLSVTSVVEGVGLSRQNSKIKK